MTHSVRVVGVDYTQNEGSVTEVDEYVPIRFRLRQTSFPKRRVRFGNLHESHLELLLDAESGCLIGFTVLSVDKWCKPNSRAASMSAVGLPIIEVKDMRDGPECIFNTNTEFSVGLADDWVEIRFAEDADEAELVCLFENLRVYSAKDGGLQAICLLDVCKSHIDLLQGYV